MLQDGWLLIDVDNYAKGEWPAGTGAATMAEARERAGCDLPPGPKLRNRTDGSEKRLFWVPPGLRFRKNLGPCVDLVTPTHRYVNAGINPDTGNPEQWFDAEDNALGAPPPIETQRRLPDAWLLLVTQDGVCEAASQATEEQAQAWLDDMPSGPMCELVREAFADALAALDVGRGSRHDRTQEQVRWLVEMGAAGVSGAKTALGQLKERFVTVVSEDRTGGAAEAGHEFDGMVAWAAKTCRPDVFHALKCLEGTGFDGWWDGVKIDEESRDDSTYKVTRSLADVEPTKVEWLWRPWLPLGKVSILEGEPDVGKSALTLTLSAIVSNGGEWPDSIVGGDVVAGVAAEAAGVVLVGVEDDYADTVVPRLIAANADLTRVHTIVQPLDARGNPVPFVVPDDVERLRRAVAETQAKLVIIDPITAFLSTSQVKAGDDPSTRQALMPLVALAAETGCAVVLVRHLNKATGMSAKHRGSGTIAFTGVTRSVIVAGKLKEQTPDGPTHAIARTKGNLSKEPMAIGYRLDSAPDDPDSPIVKWFDPLDLTADQLVGADGAKVSDARKSAPARQEAMDILQQLLSDGPVPAETAIKLTKENADCGIGVIKAASKQLGVIKKRVYVDGKVDHWTWELPPEKFRLNDVRGGGEIGLEPPEP
ncbi:AAA family ATPase [Mycobacterium sp. ZZG]